MLVKTTRCSNVGQREFTLSCPDGAVIQQDIDFFVSYLEESVTNGAHYVPGQTFQIGWMLDRIGERADGTLGISEPDFKSFPIVWVESVMLTLQHMRIQKDAAERFGLLDQMDFPGIDQ